MFRRRDGRNTIGGERVRPPVDAPGAEPPAPLPGSSDPDGTGGRASPPWVVADVPEPAVLCIEDFVPSDRTMGLNVGQLTTRLALLIFILLAAAALVVEVLRFA